MNKWRMRVGGKVQDHCVGREDNGRHYVEMREVGLHIYMCEIDISWPVAVRHESPWRPYSPSGPLQTGLGRALLHRLIIDTLHLSTVVLAYKMNPCLS